MSDTQWRLGRLQSQTYTDNLPPNASALTPHQSRQGLLSAAREQGLQKARLPSVPQVSYWTRKNKLPKSLRLLFSLVLKAWIISVCPSVFKSLWKCPQEIQIKTQILFHNVYYKKFTSGYLCEKSQIQISGFIIIFGFCQDKCGAKNMSLYYYGLGHLSQVMISASCKTNTSRKNSLESSQCRNALREAPSEWCWSAFLTYKVLSYLAQMVTEETSAGHRMKTHSLT